MNHVPASDLEPRSTDQVNLGELDRLQKHIDELRARLSSDQRARTGELDDGATERLIRSILRARRRRDAMFGPDELSGIFNLLMYALRGILRNKRISINEKTMLERRLKYEMAANPIATFLKLGMDEAGTVDDATRKETAYLRFLRND